MDFSSESFSEDHVKSFCFVPVKRMQVEPRSRSDSSETEIRALKEVLLTQQQLLHKIYFELDEEREAAATAASEALSMILRLQGEKATMKMEADQYKRLAEEKLFHAEECLEAFDDVMYQKEMEIASLEFQIQAYRCKLLSMGCSDSLGSEKRFSDNFLMWRTDAFVGDIAVNRMMRGKSLPPGIDLFSYRAGEKRDSKFNSQSLDVDSEVENSTLSYFDPYAEQIKKLDDLLKVLLQGKHSESGNESTKLQCGLSSDSLISQGSSCVSYHTARDIIDETKLSEILQESESCANSFGTPMSVEDILDVPQCVQAEQLLKEEHSSSKNELEKPDSTLVEAVEDTQKGAFGSHLALVGSVADSQKEFQQFIARTQQLEVDTKVSRQQIRSEGKDEGNLLNEKIHEQLNSTESVISSWRPLKSLQSDDLALLSLKEAMLHFWI